MAIIDTTALTTPKALYVQSWTAPDTEVLDDVLEEQEKPVEFLKSVEKRKLVIVVPNEWSWPAGLKPFTNAKHKHHYDADLLAQDLEASGWTYVMRLLEFDGWSFLCAECVKPLEPA